MALDWKTADYNPLRLDIDDPSLLPFARNLLYELKAIFKTHQGDAGPLSKFIELPDGSSIYVQTAAGMDYIRIRSQSSNKIKEEQAIVLINTHGIMFFDMEMNPLPSPERNVSEAFFSISIYSPNITYPISEYLKSFRGDPPLVRSWDNRILYETSFLGQPIVISSPGKEYNLVNPGNSSERNTWWATPSVHISGDNFFSPITSRKTVLLYELKRKWKYLWPNFLELPAWSENQNPYIGVEISGLHPAYLDNQGNDSVMADKILRKFPNGYWSPKYKADHLMQFTSELFFRKRASSPIFPLEWSLPTTSLSGGSSAIDSQGLGGDGFTWDDLPYISYGLRRFWLTPEGIEQNDFPFIGKADDRFTRHSDPFPSDYHRGGSSGTRGEEEKIDYDLHFLIPYSCINNKNLFYQELLMSAKGLTRSSEWWDFGLPIHELHHDGDRHLGEVSMIDIDYSIISRMYFGDILLFAAGGNGRVSEERSSEYHLTLSRILSNLQGHDNNTFHVVSHRPIAFDYSQDAKDLVAFIQKDSFESNSAHLIATSYSFPPEAESISESLEPNKQKRKIQWLLLLPDTAPKELAAIEIEGPAYFQDVEDMDIKPPTGQLLSSPSCQVSEDHILWAWAIWKLNPTLAHELYNASFVKSEINPDGYEFTPYYAKVSFYCDLIRCFNAQREYDGQLLYEPHKYHINVKNRSTGAIIEKEYSPLGNVEVGPITVVEDDPRSDLFATYGIAAVNPFGISAISEVDARGNGTIKLSWTSVNGSTHYFIYIAGKFICSTVEPSVTLVAPWLLNGAVHSSPPNARMLENAIGKVSYAKALFK